MHPADTMPLTVEALQHSPDRLDVAEQRGAALARRIDEPNRGLTAFVHVNPLDIDPLLALLR